MIQQQQISDTDSGSERRDSGIHGFKLQLNRTTKAGTEGGQRSQVGPQNSIKLDQHLGKPSVDPRSRSEAQRAKPELKVYCILSNQTQQTSSLFIHAEFRFR